MTKDDGVISFSEAMKSVPNWLTLFSLFTGFLSILMTSYGYHERAAWFILLAFLWDSLDGNIARAFGTQSPLGTKLDSLSDLVSFIVAPSLLVTHFFLIRIHPLFLVVIFLYLVPGVFRLARFTISSNDGIFFDGLPSTAAGFTLAAFILVCVRNEEVKTPSCFGEVVLMMATLSILMASKFQYPKASSLVFKRWRLFLAADFGAFLAGTIALNPETGFFALALFYVLLAPLYNRANPPAFSLESNYVRKKPKPL
jgi:CDP-diacylglycerol---serine O-phosphatidyltransferase